MIDYITPYTRVKLSFLAKWMNVSETEILSLLIALILENKIVGKIDQINGILDLTPKYIYNYLLIIYI